jgi:hypothetical protein
MTDSNGRIDVIGKHETEDEARDHEERLNKAYPDNHVWTCLNSGAFG